MRGPSFEQTWIPFTYGCFVPSLVEIGPVVLEKKSKIGKVYRRTDRQTDRQTTDERRSEKLTWAFSSGDLKRCWQTKRQTECYILKIYRLLPLVLMYLGTKFESCTIKTVWVILSQSLWKLLYRQIRMEIWNNRQTDNLITIRLPAFSCGALNIQLR